MGRHLSDGGVAVKGGDDLDSHTASLSEGGALAVVVEYYPETPHQKWDNWDFPRLVRQSEARLCLACRPSPSAAARRTRGCWWRDHPWAFLRRTLRG